MQRLDASRLLELLLTTRKKNISLLLCDDPIFKRIALAALEIRQKSVPVVYSGKTAVTDFVNATASGGLFSEPTGAFVELQPKYTVKQFNEEMIPIARIPRPSPVQAFFLGSTQIRNSVNEEVFKDLGEVVLTYSPSDTDLLRCAEVLLKRHEGLDAQVGKKISEVCALALEQYSGDLTACDTHFQRMATLVLTFDQALVAQSEVNAFHVVDALAQGNRYLLELRMQQCAMAGEEAGGILMALVYFLKQVTHVQAQLQKNSNLKSVLEALHIPFPSHNRIGKAVKLFDSARLARFFFSASHLEITLRSHKSPHNFLAVELLALLP